MSSLFIANYLFKFVTICAGNRAKSVMQIYLIYVQIINRIWNDMYEYLESQPSWVAATLLMSKTPHQEILLFADEEIPGRYIGVANIVRSESKFM